MVNNGSVAADTASAMWPPGRCLVIGEVAQAHDGSLGMAHAYIDAIANAGADGVKFQTHIAAAESTPAEPWRVKFSLQDETRYDYWKRMEFSERQWIGLKEHAEQRKLLFLSSPFSIEAVDLLERVGLAAWKIASGEVSNGPLFDRILAGRRPVIISTGMSPWSEIDHAAERVRQSGCELILMQCSSTYPTPPEKTGLNLLAELRNRYRCKVGLSDHSGSVFAGLAAAALGADFVEVHVTFSREAFGPDGPASVTVAELRQLVEGVHFIGTALSHPVDKDQAADELAPMRRLFTKSIVARADLPAGTVLAAEHVAFKKPGTGIEANRLLDILGRRTSRPLRADTLITEKDLE